MIDGVAPVSKVPRQKTVANIDLLATILGNQRIPNSTPVPEGEDALGMPEIMNFHESGLRRSPRVAAKQSILATVFCLGTLLTGATLSIKLGATSI